MQAKTDVPVGPGLQWHHWCMPGLGAPQGYSLAPCHQDLGGVLYFHSRGSKSHTSVHDEILIQHKETVTPLPWLLL